LPDNLRGNDHRSDTALLLVDVINDLEWPGGEHLARQALPAARAMADLKQRARMAGVPVIYVNDNFGRWRSDFRQILDRCLQPAVRGEPVARLLAPDEQDYFILKPKNSAFYGTALDILLTHLGARKLIIAGFATDICVLYSANDAHMRNYDVVVPSDCVAAESTAANEQALDLMRKALDVAVMPQAEVSLG